MANMDDIWYEKYRPKTFEEITGHNIVVVSTNQVVDAQYIKNIVKSNNMPHMIFYGPAGTGKTTLATVIARHMYGDKWSGNFKEINASDDSGIDVVRNEIKTFARSMPSSDIPFKIVLLDEADKISVDAQQALCRTMEKYSRVCRFILSCNYEQEIIEPIRKSRCVEFKFLPITSNDIVTRLKYIVQQEKINISDDILNMLAQKSYGDMRKAINDLQILCTANSGTITQDTLKTVNDSDDVKQLVTCIIQGSMRQSKAVVDKMLATGLMEQDIIERIWRCVYYDGVNFNLTPTTKMEWLLIMRDYDLAFNQRVIKGLHMDAFIVKLMSVCTTNNETT